VRSRSSVASVTTAVFLLSAPAAVAAATPQGTYRVTLGARDLVRVGASAREAGWARGTWTLTLAGRRWTLRQTNGVNGNTLDRGTIEVVAAGAAFTLRSADGFVHNEDVGTLRWTVSAAGLRFVPVVRSRNQDVIQILSARVWRRMR
jgi:hypothetical protein